MQFRGVLPAITTPFTDDDRVDHGFLTDHVRHLLDAGCDGIVALGSLGEGATLDADEKADVLRTCVDAAGAHPVVAAVSALSTREAVRAAREAEALGCRGLMVLPPYVYATGWDEMGAHVRAVLSATALPCMLYNNPPAYAVDFRAEHVAELAAEAETLVAVKESSGDARRVTALRAALGERLDVCVGLDDMAVEGAAAGAVGWVAGLVNALPAESVALWRGAIAGNASGAGSGQTVADLYRWFLPLLRLDTVPHFVQLIKLVQQEVGLGSERVRPPRLPLAGPERQRALGTIRAALAARPALA